MDKIGHKAYHDTLNVKAWACFGCPIACGRHTEIMEGKYKGESGGGPEYETVGAFGSKCYVDDLNAITEAGYICNRMGLDTISTGQTIASAMEWFEKGLIDLETTGGIDLSFGNAEAMVKMTEMIAKREGFGRKDEKLPERLSKEPAPDGLGKGQVANAEVMLDEFYESMGWDKETGHPKDETLMRLKLK